MKKILIATTALIATATVASAEVSINGFARFGLRYDGAAAVGVAKTQIEQRLRFNIDASKTTDSGVTFGGRTRVQYDENNASGNSVLNAANVYASYNGLKVTVGNVGGAVDDAALAYASEVGLIGTSFGDPIGGFYAYSSGAYAATETNRMGINVTYAISGFNVELSYINPDQTLKTLPVGTKAELALNANYKINQITLSAAVAENSGGVAGRTVSFVGAEYAVNDMANVGVLYFGDKKNPVIASRSRTVTLYGNYKMDAITLRGYVATNDIAANSGVGMRKQAYGVGVDYDLGGATLAGSIESGYNKKATATMGVKFSF